MTVVNIEFQGSFLTSSGKQEIAASMYSKGKSFLVSGMLLRRVGGSEYVVLHLFCQGIEIVLKSLLISKDYDKYFPMLKKNFGHNLAKLAEVSAKEFGTKPLSAKLIEELGFLSPFYSDQHLRYAGPVDCFIDPVTIRHQHMTIKIAAVMRLAERHFKQI